MMNVFRAVIFACVMGMVRGQTYTTKAALKSDIDNCFDTNGDWKKIPHRVILLPNGTCHRLQT